MSAVLKKTADYKELEAMRKKLLTAFRKAFLDKNGNLIESSQTAILLALHFELLSVKAATFALRRLVKSIKSRGVHLSTGFLGTPLLLPVLSKYGKTDLAYELLLQTTYPGWLFPITQGATTMWERWNSYTKEEGFGNVSMNSFNHYAYGAVANWFYRNICGIRPDASSASTAGFKHFILAPEPGNILMHAEASFCSQYGPIISSWTRTAGKIVWDFFVPGNTTAKIVPSSPIISGSEELIEGYDGTFTAGPGLYRLIMK